MAEERHDETKDAAVEAHHSGQRFLSRYGIGTRDETEVAVLTQLGKMTKGAETTQIRMCCGGEGETR